MNTLTSSRTKISSRVCTRSSSILKSTSRNVNSILNVESNNVLFQDSELDIYPNKEVVSKYSLHQLQIVMKHNILYFNNLLDFVLCSNKIIFTLSHIKTLINIILFLW